jgi:regulator of protease activity HflC (stomatin/prohibitin superfamily)
MRYPSATITLGADGGVYIFYTARGYKVSTIEIEHVDLDESLVRAIAKQAEAERSSITVFPCPWTPSMH